MTNRISLQGIAKAFLAMVFAFGLAACNEESEQTTMNKKIETDLELYEGSFRPPSPTPTPSPTPDPTPVPIPGTPTINPLPAFVTTNTFNIVGTGTAGSSISLIAGGVVVGTVPVESDLSWIVPVGPLDEGPISFTAVARFSGGEASPASETVSTIVDTVAPSAPVITRPILPSTTDKPTFEGTGEPTSTITVFINDVENGTTTVIGTGDWAYTPTVGLADGSYTATAQARDLAGNLSPMSAPRTFSVDTVAPVAPSITGPAGGITNQNRPTISGTSEVDTIVEVFSNGDPLGVAVTENDGTWSYSPADEFFNGTYEITAQAADNGGLVSPISPVFSLTVDVSAPDAPSIVGPANVTDTRTPTITGTSVPLVTVTVFLNGVVNGTVFANELGDWDYTVASALVDAIYIVRAQVTDGGGSISPLSPPFTMDVEVP